MSSSRPDAISTSSGTALGEGVSAILTPNPGPLTLDGTRTYLIGESDAVLLDPGPAIPGQLERLSSLVGAADVCRILLTHAHGDHSGVAAAASERFAAPIAASRDTLERLGLEGIVLEDGDEISIESGQRTLRVIETPGHSADSISLLLLPPRWLFAGDTVLGRGSSLVVWPDGRMSSYLATLSRLISLRPERLLPGHGPPVADPQGLLEEYRRHRLDRERQIEAAIDDGGSTIEAIRRKVYVGLAPELEGAADASVAAHLEHMAERVSLPAALAREVEAAREVTSPDDV